MRDIAPLQYPKLFQGLFARERQRFEPLIEEARARLHSLEVPAVLRPFYDVVIRENPQPSYVLLPLMYLATAEAVGGISVKHSEFLPYLMLGMEAIAVLDDTVDSTPMRSGRPTFAARFGEASATPFVSTLMALMARAMGRIEPRLLDVTMAMMVELTSLQLWERHNGYPAQEQFAQWLENRARQSAIGVALGLDTALLLGGRELAPAGVLQPFGRIFQDVDDLVNILEDRGSAGENDDLLMGMVTRPLLRTLEEHPALWGELAALWAACQTSKDAAAIAALARPIREAVREVGVPATVAQILADHRACVAAARPELRPVIRELTRTWVDRLRRCAGAEVVTQAQIEGCMAGIEPVAA